jgi:hypothetical protein
VPSLLPKPLPTSAQKMVYFAAPAVILNALRGLGERLGRGVKECATMLQPTVFELVRRQIDWREVGWQGPRNHHHPDPLDRRHHLHRHHNPVAISTRAARLLQQSRARVILEEFGIAGIWQAAPAHARVHRDHPQDTRPQRAADVLRRALPDPLCRAGRDRTRQDLVGHRVALIVTGGGDPPPLAAKSATTTIPIVFTSSSDPVKLGLVASLNRPGSNVTGFWTYTSQLGPKRFEVMRLLFPASTLIAVLVNPNNPNAHIDMPDLQNAARTVGQSISFVTASTETEIDAVFATLSERRVSALLVNTDPYFLAQRDQFVSLRRATRSPRSTHGAKP